MDKINVYTDGSCHTRLLVGSWVAIVFWNDEKIVLSGTAENTTNNRMELMAVIEAAKYVLSRGTDGVVEIYTDSQYVVGLRARKLKIEAAHFLTKRGDLLQNTDLLKELWALEQSVNIQYIKVAAHQKPTEFANYNIEADILVRHKMRAAISGEIDPEGSIDVISKN